jgi:hypothetical protein
MSKIKLQTLSLTRLKSNFENGVFAVPHIQRQFVWKKHQVTDLVDSIYRGIPIGVFLIWRTDGNKTIELKPKSNNIIPPFNYSNKTADIIIDGQQRLSSLYGILKGISPQIDDFAPIDFSKVYFDLNHKNGEKRFFYRSNLLGSTSLFIQFTEILNFSPSVLSNRYNLTNQKSKEVIKCKKRFTDYKFYALVVQSKDKKEIEETFIRINSKGMIINKADILFAQTSKVALRDRVAETKRGLKHGFNKLKDDIFTSAIALIEGQNEIGVRALKAFVKKFDKKRITKAEFKKHWKKYHHAFHQAHDFLTDDLKIATLKMLPSDNMFTMLSLFFYHNGPRVTSAQKKELKKWFWHTALGERYSGANFNKNIPADSRFMVRLSKREKAIYLIDEKIDAIDFLKKKYSNQRATSVRGFFLYLSQLNPKYLETGEPMYLSDTAAIANRRDRHHIFPSNLFTNRQLKTKWKNGLVNICLLAANENQSISDDYPCNYLEPYKKKKWFKSVMRSHSIPVKADSGVWGKRIKENFKSFINVRSRLIIDGISKVAGLKKNSLFEGFDGIKRI